jgi:ATP-dependent DNA helicase RecQ
VLRAFAASGLAFVMVEEATAASDWDPDLDVGMALMPQLLRTLGRPPLLLHAPAAVASARDDILRRYGLVDRPLPPVLIETAPVRSNLVLDGVAVDADQRHRALLGLLARLRRPGIVFCPTSRDVDSVYGALHAMRIPVHRYHGELPPGERSAELLGFVMPGRRTVMVATSAFSPTTGDDGRYDPVPRAFGSRLDKRDVRFVVHFHAPSSLEQYARDIDLAGRDGEPATCVLLHGEHDAARWREHLASARPRADLLAPLARVLETTGIQGRPVSTESLALEAGQTRVQTEALLTLIRRAGLIEERDGWLRVTASSTDFGIGIARIAESLATVVERDALRARRVEEYARTPECRARILQRYFGVASGESCGACSVCRGSTMEFLDVAATQPRRREPAQRFSIGEASQQPASVTDGRAAKLGDYVVG